MHKVTRCFLAEADIEKPARHGHPCGLKGVLLQAVVVVACHFGGLADSKQEVVERHVYITVEEGGGRLFGHPHLLG